ncbi:hypothetical protein TNCV_3116241 [Trichonephila clavipes]|nr:hypothetical protein TNCV_3116241 [Trichonephila clavipes]
MAYVFCVLILVPLKIRSVEELVHWKSVETQSPPVGVMRIPTDKSSGVKSQDLAYENREQRQSRFGPIRRIYALLDDRLDELPNQTENKSLDSC